MFEPRRVRSEAMVRGFVVLFLTVMLALQAVTPSLACTIDERQAISTDFQHPGSLEALGLAEAGGVAGSEVDPHHHTAPCHDHCNWFSSNPFQGFLPLEPGSGVELPRQMLPALLAVTVPPPE